MTKPVTLRRAIVDDAECITDQRMLMFAEIGKTPRVPPDDHRAAYIPWLRAALADGRYIGVMADAGDTSIAGAGMMLHEWQPNPDSLDTRRGYILNVYVQPEYRGQKLAAEMVNWLLAVAQEMKLPIVALHASDAGRPTYEKLGFTQTNEMRIALD
jgi:GNAT superfamily N-acetyltransferase